MKMLLSGTLAVALAGLMLAPSTQAAQQAGKRELMEYPWENSKWLMVNPAAIILREAYKNDGIIQYKKLKQDLTEGARGTPVTVGDLHSLFMKIDHYNDDLQFPQATVVDLAGPGKGGECPLSALVSLARIISYGEDYAEDTPLTKLLEKVIGEFFTGSHLARKASDTEPTGQAKALATTFTKFFSYFERSLDEEYNPSEDNNPYEKLEALNVLAMHEDDFSMFLFDLMTSPTNPANALIIIQIRDALFNLYTKLLSKVSNLLNNFIQQPDDFIDGVESATMGLRSFQHAMQKFLPYAGEILFSDVEVATADGTSVSSGKNISRIHRETVYLLGLAEAFENADYEESEKVADAMKRYAQGINPKADWSEPFRNLLASLDVDVKMETAAKAIQRSVRARQARTEVKRKDQAVRTIQAAVKQREAKKKQAARLIEQSMKNYKARKKARQELNRRREDRERQEAAAKTLQRGTRSRQARKKLERLKKEKAAAQTIQRARKRARSRQQLRKAVEKRVQKTRREKAALKLQSAERGRRARKQVRRLRKEREERRKAKRARRQQAAVRGVTKFQAAVRGRKTRQELERQRRQKDAVSEVDEARAKAIQKRKDDEAKAKAERIAASNARKNRRLEALKTAEAEMQDRQSQTVQQKNFRQEVFKNNRNKKRAATTTQSMSLDEAVAQLQKLFPKQVATNIGMWAIRNRQKVQKLLPALKDLSVDLQGNTELVKQLKGWNKHRHNDLVDQVLDALGVPAE